MKTNRMHRISMIIGALWVIALGAAGGITNTVPWSDSFEPYTNGMSVNGTNGWTSGTADGGIVTTNKVMTDLLTNYPVSGRSYPLPASTHSNILQVATQVSVDTASASGGVVRVDFMATPDWMSVMPEGDPTLKFSVCVSTNGKLTIWYHNTAVVPATNQWLELVNSPVIASNAWARFTILQDNSNRMFQIRVNESDPISDSTGWASDGVTPNGPWYHMVQTNPAMSQLIAAGVSTYLDDVVVNKRTLSWSGTNFTERTVNDGVVDSSSPILITLALDTFSGTVGDNFTTSGKMTVVGLPSNLTAVAQLVSTTQVSVTLLGTALAHEAVNSATLAFQFADTAFTLGRAWDVAGSQAHVRLTFLDTPSLGYSTNHFQESSANNGTIDNTPPLLITLTNGTFAGGVNEDFATNSSRLVIGNMPAGLTGQVLRLSATQLQFELLGAAVSNNAANGIANLTLSFRDGAFTTVPASSVFNSSAVFSVSYSDASSLGYAATLFTEIVANNGAISGTTLTLVNKSFNATNGEDLVASGKVTKSNLPGGLVLQVVRGATAQDATVLFTGTAGSHAQANSISNLGITFLDSAFVGGNAAGVVNSAVSTLQIQFIDPRTLSYSAAGFTELAAGLIDNRHPMIITLVGDTLTGANGDNFAPGKITVGSLPHGLTAQIARVSATLLSVQLTGVATAHASGNSVTNVTMTFGDGAFTGGNASYVGNYAMTGITVTFVNDTGFFNVVPYQEPFESYASGTLLGGSNGWSALYHADACVVTNAAGLATKLLDYLGAMKPAFPVTGTHTQVLFVQDYIEDAIHRESAPLVYLDVLAMPAPLQGAPTGDTNVQFSFYVSTNCQLVIWHRDVTGGSPVNQWLTLASAPLISTSSWVRFTVTQDYTNSMFQIQVNEGAPISDPAGWSLPKGGVRPGSWFHMVQTNGTMSAFGMAGVGVGYLDDVTVRTQLPNTFGGGVPGTIYTFR